MNAPLPPTPVPTGDFAADGASFSAAWSDTAARLARLPAKPKRGVAEQQEAQDILDASRASRRAFAAAHARSIYDKLTANRSRFVRVEELVYEAATLLPGLVPTREQVAAEAVLAQKDKDGHEIDQGLLLSAFLADQECGTHLCHAMLLPTDAAMEKLRQYDRDGAIDLGNARVERQGKASIATIRNARFLNAEDDGTLVPVEQAIDLCLLDPQSVVCVLRGEVLEHPKYKGRRAFCTGINLTRLYHGHIPYLWYITREMGFVNKMYRGLALPGITPDETAGDGIEKVWIAQVDTFAIGGGCQYLLAMDYAVAGSDAYLTLPARKEGIIPGAANLRLPRFVGDRIARQAVMMERRIDCDSPEGRMICDAVVPPGEVEAEVARVVERISSAGTVSAAGNRRAFRVVQEPLDAFRRYLAVYAREQAYCHFSPALISNLEKHWNAANRKA